MIEIQPAVKKETRNVTIYCVTGLVLMLVIFGILHGVIPHKVPFDYTVILGGIGGCAVSILNFFLMGLAVQKVAATDDEAQAKSIMKVSYSKRMLFQVLWIIAVAVAPCFHLVAGLVPLLFPGIGIKLMGIINRK